MMRLLLAAMLANCIALSNKFGLETTDFTKRGNEFSTPYIVEREGAFLAPEDSFEFTMDCGDWIESKCTAAKFQFT